MNTSPMASAISTPSYSYHSSSSSSSSSSIRRPIICSLICTLNSNRNFPNIRVSALIPHLGLTPSPQWSGLRQLSVPISQKFLQLGRRRKCRGKVIVASLFGVGAPEALVIGVVALLVFGPKGLAEVARNLGKTLRAFQPTIRELQEVSRDFKSTLEKEIGLDDIQNPLQGNYNSTTTGPTSRPSPVATPENSVATVDPNGKPSPNKAYSSEDYLKITEEQLKAAASIQQKEQTLTSLAGSELERQSQSQDDTVQGEAGTTPAVQEPKNEL